MFIVADLVSLIQFEHRIHSQEVTHLSRTCKTLHLFAPLAAKRISCECILHRKGTKEHLHQKIEN